MSDPVLHECGLALLRLLRPLDYYRRKYGSAFYGFQKMSLLLEKQHNRGQDGAGLASLAFNVPPGVAYYHRERSNSPSPLETLLERINSRLTEFSACHRDRLDDAAYLKANAAFCGELYLGHLRYGTFGRNDLEACHPYLRESICPGRTLMIAGNFNLTNVAELFNHLKISGHHLTCFSDGGVMLHLLGHYLEEENNLAVKRCSKGCSSAAEIAEKAEAQLDVGSVLRCACSNWDGGFAVAGLIGNGDAFAIRDPHGIRPCYYYIDDEIAVAASERPPIQTAFNLPPEAVRELPRGHAMIVRKDGSVRLEECLPPAEPASCSFERIYFSRGNDADIYRERKRLGRFLAPAVLEAVDRDLENTVFSFIPNTAEIGFSGLVDGLTDYCRERQYRKIKELEPGDDDGLRAVLNLKIRAEKIAVKDAKLRTFISDGGNRHELIGHVYDTTGGIIRPQRDNLVVLDDSIVRGATMRDSILRILDRLGPRRIVVASTAPPILYPDCYGIDMADLGELVAFEAAVRLLKKRECSGLLNQVMLAAQRQLELPDHRQKNVVRQIYEPFTHDELSREISAILKPPGLKAELTVIYQKLEHLHQSCPNHRGDWYFSGNYPTPGGNRVANRAFVNYMEGVKARPY